MILSGYSYSATANFTSPTFRDALQTQLVVDAVLESARTGRWTDVEQMG